MNIIRDNELGGILMIPLLVDWGIRRCNVRDCANKPNTIIGGAGRPGEDVPAFGLCEQHYQECKTTGQLNYTLVWDEFDAFKEAPHA